MGTGRESMGRESGTGRERDGNGTGTERERNGNGTGTGRLLVCRTGTSCVVIAVVSHSLSSSLRVPTLFTDFSSKLRGSQTEVIMISA